MQGEEISLVPSGDYLIPKDLNELVDWLDIKEQGQKEFGTKTSGHGFASDKRNVTGNDSATDLLKAIDNGSDILTMDVDYFNPFAEMDPFADASLDSFVDLSEYLMEKSTPTVDLTPLDVTEVTPDTDILKSVDEGSSVTNKRTWEEIVDFVEEKPNPTSPDHDYSTKRPRLTSSLETESPNNQPSTSTRVDKYKVRREKNNIASKRSREIRKNKFSEMEEKAQKFEVENEAMRDRIIVLEALAKEMKATLVARLAGK
ncbi:hypothetical protein LOTGIDRAFT_233964 [Lottia gigantea]|uniref:BZIP domain-containing protein n=1 Tax=Lottia gigantea TaxID=225164 RepID=V4A0H8_LOTGI|nr:hypothetical protein LOTGIDRAFT_233964 [Lottia gigantea]ESO90172.1 hypothetical protein LOTGIDRAFT_233964 [Lottia gigantea]